MSKLKFISASAGTGKTFRLTTLLIQSILKDNDLKPSEVIITTYTKAAASEIRQRCFERLVEAAQNGMFINEGGETVPLSSHECELLTNFAVQIDDAHISDIHGICFEFIRKYALIAGFDPNVKLLDEKALKAFFNKCIFKCTTDSDYDFFNRYKERYGVPNPKSFDEFWLEAVNSIVKDAVYHSVALKDCVSYCEAEIRSIFCVTIAECDNCLDVFLNNFSALPKLHSAQVKWIGSMRGFDFSAITRDDLWESQKFGHDVSKYPTVLAQWEDVQKKASTCEAFAAGAIDCMRKLFDVAEKFMADYEKMKRDQGYIDYNDMELRFLDLLKITEISDDISNDIELVMVDEFQDCNPIQLQIFEKLSDMISKGKYCRKKLEYQTYWVGDAKQAIYQFRGSDTNFFNTIISKIPSEDLDNSLSVSYRSRKPIIDAVNAFFGKIYSNYKVITAHREKEETQFGNNALLHWHLGDKKTKYEQLAKYINWLVASGRPVKPKGQDMRPVGYGDIVLLVRSWTETGNVERELMDAGIPINLKKNTLRSKFEVELLKEFVRYVDDENEHSRACLLHLMCDVPTSDILCNCKKTAGRWIDNASFVSELKTFRDSVRYLSVAAVVKAIVAQFNILDVVGKWGYAEQRQQRVMRVVMAADEFENSCAVSERSLSFKEFLAFLDGVDMELKGLNNNAVTVTTYHSSKGLEWPVVILDSLYEDEFGKSNFVKKNLFGVSYVDATNLVRVVPPIQEKWTNQLDISTVSFLTQKKGNVQAEMLNLLYVGATRARDYLVTLSTNGENGDGNSVALPWVTNLPNVGIEKFPIENDKIEIWGKDCPSDVTKLPQQKVEPKIAKEEGEKPESEPVVERATVETQNEWEQKLVSEVVKETRLPLYVNPSGIKNKDVLEPEYVKLDVDDYLASADNATMTDIGTCVHNIFAVCQPNSHDESLELAKSVIAGFGFGLNIVPEKVVSSIEALYNKLGVNASDKVEHELAFTVLVGDQIVRGEIDMLWYRPDGKVTLIDFKNTGDSLEQIKDSSNQDTFCGKYYGQLDLYRTILKNQGLEIAEMMLYYPRYGLIAKF